MRISKNSLALASVVVAVAVAACKKEDGPDAFIRASIKAVNGEPQAVWQALPPSYQKDVQGLVAGFANGMNEQVWNDGLRLGQKAVKVLETKKEFVLGYPQVQAIMGRGDFGKGWDPTVHILSTIVNSDLKTLEGVKKLDVEQFLTGPVASVTEDLVKVAEVATSAMPAAKSKDIAQLRAHLASAKITVEKVEENTATVKVEIEGEKPETEQMVKVEEKWIPKELADAWPMVMTQAKANVASLKVDPAMVVQFNAMKGMVEPVLDGLLAAKTQEEFNGQIDAVMGAMMGGRHAGGAVAQASPETDTLHAPALDARPMERPIAHKTAAKSGKRSGKQRRQRH